LVTNPIFTSQSVSLINLSDGSKKVVNTDFGFIGEYCFDHIYGNDGIFDFDRSSFINPLTFLNENSRICYYDEKTKYYIVTEYFKESIREPYFSRMYVYKDGQIVFQQPFEKGRSFSFPRIMNISDNKIIFAQYHEYDSTVKYDGYYQLDLNTKKISLLQNEDTYFLSYDFFIADGDNSFISVRPYEIYHITIN
jgi:hypothetical protein